MREHAVGDFNARALLAVLSLSWGLTWPFMKIALIEIPPFSMRTASAAIGAVMLFMLARLRRHDLRPPQGAALAHLVVSSVLNIVGFSMFSAFAQINATTSRVTILAYTMPIWASLLARLFLGERLNAQRVLALALCVGGLAILVYPLAASGVPIGLLFAVGAGVSWAAGTIYLKWTQPAIDPLANVAWQLVVGSCIIGAGVPLFEGALHVWPASWQALFGVAFTGAIGTSLAYVLWFEAVRRLPAMTASLGVLSVPVIGVLSSMLLLGERPTLTDFIGFALIFAASACVLLQPQEAAGR